jgi:hypothetical protein
MSNATKLVSSVTPSPTFLFHPLRRISSPIPTATASTSSPKHIVTRHSISPTPNSSFNKPVMTHHGVALAFTNLDFLAGQLPQHFHQLL